METPRCSICKKFYKTDDDNGSGLCLTCRPVNSQPLLKQELIQPGRFGITNAQLIPAMKQAIYNNLPEDLRQLKSAYFYIFERSIKYLKKDERNYIQMHLSK
ncbi:hypothetical protein HSX37_06785|uniref:Uncharacterized protein n=1 Tax=Dendrosporobacter quercicolus TaxID=146817 RepID=A0A1G9W120_9FIRM|nr:hypothetical protein [Dendrosporobacter quercicolus]NSL47748.1 hypothetical protein [Dendrosporobacter quercicolus DSM 1736]SDM78219.1 hypothetical protein SAMN04488502_10793 [Dendrosporobacter quercicolus]